MWIFILALFLSTNLLAQETLTLEEAISIALQRNSNLIKGQNALMTDEARIKSAYGDFLPNLGINGNWSWSRRIDDGGEPFFVEGYEFETQETDIQSRNFSLSAGGNITLFDGLANYARLSQAKNDLESAEFSLTKLKQDIVYTTTFYYYGTISSGELVKVREDN
jgi:outer membrane protein